jgi:hypothetical protein
VEDTNMRRLGTCAAFVGALLSLGAVFGSSVKAADSPKIGVPGKDASWSLKEREQWAKLTGATQEHLDRVNRTCGAKIVADYAFETFRGHFSGKESFGLDGYGRAHANASLDALSDVCVSGAMEKDAVKSKITRVEIRWGGTGNSSFAVNGTALVATISPHPPGEAGDNAATYREHLIAGLKEKL